MANTDAAAARSDRGDPREGARLVVTWLRDWAGRAGGRLRDAWFRIIVLDTVTAAGAWVIAQQVLGQRAPVFAPIAAIVCLTDAPGKRGRRGVRLLFGVLVGVAVGEVARLFFTSGWAQIACALALGMIVVALGSINPLTLLQAGIAALLVVGTASAQSGWTRLFSALIGGVLALLVSQVLAAPSARKLLAGAASTALRPVVGGLDQVADALRSGSADCARRAAEGLRDGHESLAGFLETRASGDELVVSTLRGRAQRRAVHRLQRRFAGLEYVYASSVLLARTATEAVEAGETIPEHLVLGVADLAGALRAIADDPTADDPRPPGGHGRPSRGAHEVAEELVDTDPDEHSAGPARLATQLHLLAADVASMTSAPAPSRATPPARSDAAHSE